MQITYLESIDSTQTYLKNKFRKKELESPHAIVANIQTDGKGSRDNSWQGFEGNLFLSFGISLDFLPNDLLLESSSIYFAYILKEVLIDMGSSVWLKWPNDFYINDVKIGGMITNIVDNTLICGVGINLISSPKEFATLDINISRDLFLKSYFEKIKNIPSWKQIFSKYKVEFVRNRSCFTHNNNLKISLENAILQDDGSIIINGKRIYSTR